LHQPIQLAIPKATGPFSLDQNKIDEIEKGWVRVADMPQRDIVKVDLSEFCSPLEIKPSTDGITKYPLDKFQALLSKPPSKGHVSPFVSPRQQTQQYNYSPGNHFINEPKYAFEFF